MSSPRRDAPGWKCPAWRGLSAPSSSESRGDSRRGVGSRRGTPTAGGCLQAAHRPECGRDAASERDACTCPHGWEGGRGRCPSEGRQGRPPRAGRRATLAPAQADSSNPESSKGFQNNLKKSETEQHIRIEMTTCRPGDGLIRRRRWDSDRKQGAQPGQGGRWGGEAATLSRSCLPGAAQRARGRSEGRGAPCRGPRAEAPSSARPVRGGGSCSFVQSVLTSQGRPAGPDGGRPTASGSRSFPGSQPALRVPG